MDVIFAEATPPGRGGVSVIRLSGFGSRALVEKLCGPLARPRHAFFRPLIDEGEVLDQGLVLWFEAGASFTGEESCELQLHGAPVVVRRVGRALLRHHARPAEAGEFTRRAFMNGRLDLAEIEGLGDLLAAETEMQRRQAMRTASGEVTQRIEGWRHSLIRAGALTEASIDFADEDVPDDVPGEVFEIVAALHRDLEREISGFSAAEQVRRGFEVAVVGEPNAGKSSLINRIARRHVALVSQVPGTTRDVIELRLDLEGMAVTFLDTAGIRIAGDVVEQAGVELAVSRATTADLRLHVSPEGLAVKDLWQEGDLIVRSKADLGGAGGGTSVSSVTGFGVDGVLASVATILRDRVSGASLVTHERQLHELSAAADALALVGAELPAELVAEQLRSAAAALDRVVGRVAPDDYLDVIFSSFCIGK